MVKDLADAQPSRRVYLALNDYGMGALWWWIRASSPEEITAAFAEVEVVSNPETIAQARTRDLDELDIEDAKCGKLASFHRESAAPAARSRVRPALRQGPRLPSPGPREAGHRVAD